MANQHLVAGGTTTNNPKSTAVAGISTAARTIGHGATAAAAAAAVAAAAAAAAACVQIC
jgi:hypothetical protein